MHFTSSEFNNILGSTSSRSGCIIAKQSHFSIYLDKNNCLINILSVKINTSINNMTGEVVNRLK